MRRALTSVLWYGILALGTWRAFSLTTSARRRGHAIERARGAAEALGIAGLVVWFFYVLNEARNTIGYASSQPDVMEWLSVLGASIIWGFVILIPMWLPRGLLVGKPGETRCGLAAFVSGAIAVFVGACILISPLLMSFASSLAEFLRAVIGLAIPLGVLTLIAMTTAKLARRARA